jgi:ribosome-associated protein
MDRDFTPEFNFIASRSGGAGGQNVNKVNTKVMLFFDVHNSFLLTEEEKQRILEKLSNKINQEGILQISSQKGRTQLANKELCIEKFYQLIKKALAVPKTRKKTRPSGASVEKRLVSKKKISEIKVQRKKVE